MSRIAPDSESSASPFSKDIERFVHPASPPTGVRRIWKIVSEPGLTAVGLLRLQLHLDGRGHQIAARIVHLFNLRVTGLEVGHGAIVGSGLVTKHPLGVVIGSNSRIGENCVLLGKVTLGEKNVRVHEHHCPTLGDGVVVGTGATILGDVIVARDTTIAAHAVVTVDVVEAGTTVAGVPARPLRTGHRRDSGEKHA